MAKTVTEGTDGVGVDLTELRGFSKALRKAQPEIAKGMAANLRTAGGIVSSEAKILGEGAGHEIPPSVKVRLSGLTVSVVAGGNGMPIAGLKELGNKGATTAQETFRHPVFGGKVWVEQSTHPYLLPALLSKGDAAVDAILTIVDDVITVVTTDRG